MKGNYRKGMRLVEADLSDSVLIDGIRKKDEEALSMIYDRYCRKVFSLIFRIVGEKEVAEEILQDVFFQLWQQASKYDANRGPLAAWLLVVARSRAIDHLRAKSNVRLTQREPLDPFLAIKNSAPGLNKEDTMMEAEKAALIRNALDLLPSPQRHAIELAYFEGLSQSEIAEKSAEALGTVKSRIRLGMIKLRETLAQHFRVVEP